MSSLKAIILLEDEKGRWVPQSGRRRQWANLARNYSSPHFGWDCRNPPLRFYRQNYKCSETHVSAICSAVPVLFCHCMWPSVWSGGDKVSVFLCALVRPFPVDLTKSSLIDNTFHPENKQSNQTSETPSYNAWTYLQWTMNGKEASNVHVYKEYGVLPWSRTSI